MSLLQNELARWKNGQLELRPEPLRVRWAFDELFSSDGHAIRCAFSCSVRGLPDPTERRMLQEVLLQGRTSVADRDLTDHFTKALRAAAQRVAEAEPVNRLLGEEGKQPLVEALRAAAGPVAFACGVEILPPFHVDVESPTLQQQRQRSMQRTMAEQATAAQIEHLQRAGELFKQFQEMRRAEPGLSAGQVLQQISPADRGSVLQKLLMASASSGAGAKELYAVAGSSLVRVDRGGGTYRPVLTELPTTLGPLRSVQPAQVRGRRVLLVGAQTGFFVAPADAPSDVVAYSNPSIQSQLGFSRVVFSPEAQAFWGCHGDAGVVRWDLDRPDEPLTVYRPERTVSAAFTAQTLVTGAGSAKASGPRNLQALDGRRLIFSVGPGLFTIADRGEVAAISTESRADVVGIIPDEARLHVVHEDGTVSTVDRNTLELAASQRRAGRVRAAGALPWLGEVRLLLAGEDGPVLCLGFDDQLITHYASPHQALRAVTGSADLVAAVSADRQRLVLWDSWDGRKPAAELHLGGLARHRIAEVAFA
jgi:hypothetical protein